MYERWRIARRALMLGEWTGIFFLSPKNPRFSLREAEKRNAEGKRRRDGDGCCFFPGWCGVMWGREGGRVGVRLGGRRTQL